LTNDIQNEIPLDPGEWTEPTEEFPAKLVKCRRQTTDDATDRDGVTFTERRGYPRPAQQFVATWERLDAVWDNDDGTVSPVKVYLSLDLERFIDGRFISMQLSRGNNKATYTLDMWKKGGVRLAPTPEANEGNVYMVTYLRSKMFGTVAAKKISFPTAKLPDDYVFKGDVTHLKSTTTSLNDSADAIEAESTTAAQAASFDEDELVGLLVGVKADAMTAFISEHKDIPAAVRLELVDGVPQKALIDAGKLAIDEDGAYVVPASVA
jgi:hypothetical protein